MNPRDDRVGAVAIGRNEGDRLKRCLESLLRQDVDPIVYVDSGSQDGSVEYARSRGIHVVNLDLSRPFTMARGRNAGFAYLRERYPRLRWVQFVDGDCEVDPTWISVAIGTLETREDVAVVAGRRRERQPEASVYNRLIDLEWDGPRGEVRACGGDALIRTEVFSEVGGFNEAMIAGEEGELCARIRGAGWKILRLPDEMTLHDAAITRFGQWWKRAVRGGHARVEGMALHGASPHRQNVRETMSIVLYGLVLPSMILATGALGGVLWGRGSLLGPWLIGGAGALAAAAYGLLFLRVYVHRRKKGNSRGDARLYATFCVAGKFPEAAGVLKYLFNRLRGKRSGLIEYKAAGSGTAVEGR